jgi:TRAP transporter TAXI family solute receptor
MAAAWRVSAQTAADGRGAFLLGTSSTGDSYHPVGVALSTLVKLKLLPESGIDLTAVNTAGSRQNVDLVRQGDVQFAIVSALAAHDARTGSGDFERFGPDDNLRAVATLWQSVDHLLIRDDAVTSGTITDFLDLTGRPVSLGREDTNTLLENRKLMAALGVDIDSAFELTDLGSVESVDALAAGQIDGMGASGSLPLPVVTEAYDKLGGEAALLDIDDEQFSQIDGGRGLWQRVVIPSGTYPGQIRDIFAIGVPNILVVHEDVGDDIVYQITRTLFEELDYLHGLHESTRNISLEGAVTGLPLPIHAGAQRYFEERDIELPLPPIQLDPDLLTGYGTVEQARESANRGVISMFAGTEGDTATQIAAELASVLDVDRQNVRLLVTNGGGMGRNLTDLLYLRGVDTALVRSDLMNYAQSQDVYPPFESAVNYITEMFPEEVHLLVRSDIAELSDLTGKRINLGAPGTGADVTASVILSELGVRAEPTRFEARLAIEKLANGEIDGAFFVGGEPMPLLRQIDRNSGLKLIAVPPVDYFDSYRAAEIEGSAYPNLMRPDETVSTIAVRTALLTYSWRAGSTRYQALGEMTDALFDSLLILQDGDYHAKWLEVDPTATFSNWRRFEPANVWIDNNEGTARRIAAEGRARLEQRELTSTDSTAATPLPIETEVNGIFVQEEEIDALIEDAASSRETSIETIDDAASAIAEPTGALIEPPSSLARDSGQVSEDVSAPEPSPLIEPASSGESAADAASTGSGVNGESSGAGAIVPRPAVSNVPSLGVKAPTF